MRVVFHKPLLKAQEQKTIGCVNPLVREGITIENGEKIIIVE